MCEKERYSDEETVCVCVCVRHSKSKIKPTVVWLKKEILHDQDKRTELVKRKKGFFEFQIEPNCVCVCACVCVRV